MWLKFTTLINKKKKCVYIYIYILSTMYTLLEYYKRKSFSIKRNGHIK